MSDEKILTRRLNYRLTINLKQAVVWAILMESGDGISDKSSAYALEKLMAVQYDPNPQQILDSVNLGKFNSLMDKWS